MTFDVELTGTGLVRKYIEHIRDKNIRTKELRRKDKPGLVKVQSVLKSLGYLSY